MGDFYDVLNIPKDSSPDQIRKAYKTLVRKWHPDKHPSSTKREAETKFKAITHAYEALSGGEYRTMFGVYGVGGSNSPLPRSRSIRNTAFFATSKSTSGAPANTMFFKRKPPPIERRLVCTLEELFRGCKKEVRYTRDVVGVNGGISKKEEVEIVKVKPGWKKGTKVTFEEKGDERPGSVPSDVVFSIAEKEHPYFKRSGNDLILKVEVPLVNALTGWTISFRLLNGEKMNCSFENEIISPGYEKVIKGEGMPIDIAHQKGQRGDLRIKFIITFPKRLTEAQRFEIKNVLKECH